VSVRYRCNTCGARAEGSLEELHRKGWRCRTLTKNGRNKRICACPQHVDMMQAELGGRP
jgi:DNA-directed RNA polymerase subunit RPC12/RpoP